jgi:predicted metal-dependent hydrolase
MRFKLAFKRYIKEVPKHLGEFVIVHELVHLLAPNHGKVFKSFMLAYLPDWEERELRLNTFSVRAIA